MTGNGFAGPMGGYLSVSFENKDWHIMIRMTNGRTFDGFMEYHGRIVTHADVAKFVPNWDSLEWHPFAAESLCSGGVAARDRKVSVRLLTTGNSPLSNEQIIEEFKEFMGDKSD